MLRLISHLLLPPKDPQRGEMFVMLILLSYNKNLYLLFIHVFLSRLTMTSTYNGHSSSVSEENSSKLGVVVQMVLLLRSNVPSVMVQFLSHLNPT